MFRNYIRIAIRNIVRNKVYSAINFAGLSLGMACFIMIFLWINNEISYEKHHRNADELYTLITEIPSFDSEPAKYAVTPSAMAEALVSNYPEIINGCRFRLLNSKIVRYEDNFYNENNLVFTDSSFIDMFTVELINGNRESALSRPNSVIISDEIAEKYFGNDDPVGKALNVDNVVDLEVTGVFESLPENSHIQFDFLASFDNLEHFSEDPIYGWGPMIMRSYVLLKKNADLEKVNDKISNIYEKHYPNLQSPFRLRLLNITEIHLNSVDIKGLGDKGDIKYIYILSAAVLFILLSACINFTNLTTAKSISRAKEIGLRKVVGAFRRNILFQFIFESVIVSVLALTIALVLVWMLLPAFNSLTLKNLSLDLYKNPFSIISLIAISVFTGVISGAYPALLLSGFSPLKTLKGDLLSKFGSQKGSVFRNVLVIKQFALSTMLIICTVMVYNQLQFMKDKELGLNKENILVINLNEEIKANFNSIKNQLSSNPDILSITQVSSIPSKATMATTQITWEGVNTPVTIKFNYVCVDHEYLNTFGLELIEGRFISMEDDQQENVTRWVLNETAVKTLGIDSPLGKRFWNGTIIGIVEDFNNNSLHKKINPLGLVNSTSFLKYMCIKLRSEDLGGTMRFVEEQWEKVFPYTPLEYTFLDEEFDKLYRNEQSMGKVFYCFACLAVCIAVLGLLGMITFECVQKKKEIGIRKALGSNTLGIAYNLSKDIILEVTIANLIALPVGWILIQKWLENFAYRTDLNINIFILAGLSAYTIALLTISFQTIKAARSNPVDSLRYE